MIFHPTPLAGVYLIDIEAHGDARGFFARTVCLDEFARHGLEAGFIQQSISWNPQQGTLRGMHYQLPPYQEIKLVRVTRGAIFDVIIDLRPASLTFGHTYSVELSAQNRRQLYIPAGLAHGFQSLLPDTEILYQMNRPFHPGSARGLRWNDPRLSIAWPDHQARLISQQDMGLPTFDELFPGTPTITNQPIPQLKGSL